MCSRCETYGGGPREAPVTEQFLVCLDVETFLIQEGRQVPPLVVYGLTTSDGEQWVITHKAEGMYRESLSSPWRSLDGSVTPDALVLEMFKRVRERKGKFVNHNLAFDMGVLGEAYPHLLRPIFDMYEDNLCECTILRERLLDIAQGQLGLDFGRLSDEGKPKQKFYNLKDLAFKYFKADLDKTSWRKGYGELYNIPFKFWEEGAKQYVIDDTEWTLALFEAQREIAGTDIPNSPEQARAAFALYLTSAWGLRTDGTRVKKYKDKLLKKLAAEEEILIKLGVVRPRNPKTGKATKNLKATKDLLRSVCEGLGLPPVLTDTGLEKQEKGELDDPWKYLSTSSEFIDDLLGSIKGWELENNKEAPSEWKKIGHLSEFSHAQKLLGTFIPILERGTKYPVNPKYQTLVETGRASASSPNVMQMPREPGTRECFVPRPGFVFCSVDYEALELHTLAQACLELVGHSTLAEALNNNVDPHLQFACNFLIPDIDYNDAKKIRKDDSHPQWERVNFNRNVAKATNFGIPGGLSFRTMVRYLKNSGIIVTETYAKHLKDAYLKQWPEMKEYFRIIRSMLDPESNLGVAEQLFTNRVRGNVKFTALCNTFFQGLGADCAKESLHYLAKGAYVDEKSPLFGSRLVAFIHDETIMEHPIADAHLRGAEQARIMRDIGNKMCKDVPLKAEPCLMKFWSKKAVEVFENGVLVPWNGNFDEIVGIVPKIGKAA